MISALQSTVGVTGVGSHVPDRVLENEELAAALADTTADWIWSRTGIRERRIAAPGEASSDLAYDAARAALASAGREPDEVDLIVVATITPDMSFPSTASLLQHRLGATRAGAYDVSCACAGFVYALAQAAAQLHAGLARSALVVGADTISRIVDWEDRSTAVLFGDGAGAVVLEQGALAAPSLLGFELGSDGSGADELCVPASGSRRPITAEGIARREHLLRMNGREVFRFAGRVIVESAERLLAHCGLAAGDVDWFVSHQANQRILDYAVERLGVERARVLANLERYGNTSAASIPIVLAEAAEQGKLRAGDRVLMVGYGAGLAWGSCVMEWGLA